MTTLNTIVVVSKEDKHACADINIKTWFDKIIANDLHVINLATKTQLDMVRLMHIDKVIHIENIYFNEHILNIDKHGSLDRYPEGLFDQDEKIIAKILGWI